MQGIWNQNKHSSSQMSLVLALAPCKQSNNPKTCTLSFLRNGEQKMYKTSHRYYEQDRHWVASSIQKWHKTSGLQIAFASPILCSSSSITKAVKIAFQQSSTSRGVTVLSNTSSAASSMHSNNSKTRRKQDYSTMLAQGFYEEPES